MDKKSKVLSGQNILVAILAGLTCAMALSAVSAHRDRVETAAIEERIETAHAEPLDVDDEKQMVNLAECLNVMAKNMGGIHIEELQLCQLKVQLDTVANNAEPTKLGRKDIQVY